MKKVIAILLALIMVFSLVACTDKDTDTDDDTTDDTTTDDTTSNDDMDDTSTGTAGESDTSAAAGMGFYDSSYDYSQNTGLKIAYMTMTTGALYEAFNQAHEKWATERLYCEYTYYDANGNADSYISTLETLAAQGYTGFIIDSGAEIISRVGEVMDELEVSWMPNMTSPTGNDGKYIHPYVGFDGVTFGVDMANYVINYATENWADFNIEEAAMISINFSVSTEINDRTIGAKQVWDENYPNYADSFFELDSVTEGGMTEEAAYNLVSTIMASHSEYTYWLICTAIDNLAEGAARAAENYNTDDTTVVTTCGGNALIGNWDSGVESCWVSAFYCDQSCYCEPIINGLYAIMMGWTTPEDLWYDWVDHGNDETYAHLLLKAFPLEHDTYQDYLEFTDWYSGWDTHDYGEWSGTEYTLIDEIPASYNA